MIEIFFVIIILECVVSLVYMFIKFLSRKNAQQYIQKKAYILFKDNESICEEIRTLAEGLSKQLFDYNMYIEQLGIHRVYFCSSSVLKGAENNPIKYIVKYSKIEKNIGSLIRLNYCYEYLCKLEKLKIKSKALSQQMVDIDT